MQINRNRPTLAMPLLGIAAMTSLVVGVTTAPSHAATIFQTVDDTSDSSPNWNGAEWGSPPAAPTAANDYVSDGNDVTQLRTGGGGTFDGNSLTLRNGVTFVTKGNFSANLFLESNGRILAGNSEDPVGGSITVNTGQSGIYDTGNGRSIEVGAAVAGGGTLVAKSNGDLTIDSTANTFDGTWSTSGAVDLIGRGNGSLGTGDFDVNADGTLAIDYDFAGASTSDLTIATDGQFALDSGFDYSFQNVTLDGDSLAPGLYTYGGLSSARQAFFVEGNDSFTVAGVPEPASLALLGVGGLLMLGGRRRQRSA